MKRFRFLQGFFWFVVFLFFLMRSSSIKRKWRQSSLQLTSLKMSRQFRWINGFTRERKNIKIYFKYLISSFFIRENMCFISSGTNLRRKELRREASTLVASMSRTPRFLFLLQTLTPPKPRTLYSHLLWLVSLTGCTPQKCGRAVIDGVVTREEAQALRR